MMDGLLQVFILGITVSFGPCVAHCSLVILPYIATTTQTWKGGLKAILAFSTARLAIYGALGLLAGLVGQTVIERLRQFEPQIMISGGALIAALGLYILLRRSGVVQCRAAACGPAHRADIGGAALLGLFAGILPCLPLLGVLTFTALQAQDLGQGALYGLAFGAGKLFSPLILLGMLAGSAPALLRRYGRVLSYFTRFCGAILIFVGITLIVPQVMPLWR